MIQGTLENICALGAGRMGRGIAQTFAFAGHSVQLVDLKLRSPAELNRTRSEAFEEIDSNLRTLARLGVFEDRHRQAVLGRIQFVSANELDQWLPQADVVFEGVPEIVEAKRDALEVVGKYVSPDALVASTTSTFLSTELAEYVQHSGKFLNAHWLNPAYLIPLVELSPHPKTDPISVNALKVLLEKIGKKPVVCSASPGYIVPRLQALIMNEAARMVEQGVASAKEIDRATRYGFGVRYAAMGVVEFIDFGGNDILFYASRYLSEALNDPRYESPPIVNSYMREGRNGLKSGRGFYEWEAERVQAYREESTKRLLVLLNEMDLLPQIVN